MKRYALVKADRQVPAYMPGNYRVIAEVNYVPCETDTLRDILAGQRVMAIAGEDNAGWTLDKYVIPRLMSGLHSAWEVGLDHPVFKTIPDSSNRLKVGDEVEVRSAYGWEKGVVDQVHGVGADVIVGNRGSYYFQREDIRPAMYVGPQ